MVSTAYSTEIFYSKVIMSRTIHFTLLTSELDNRVTDQHQLDWDDLCTLLGEHDISPVKEVRMISPVQFRAEDDILGYDPAPSKVYKKDAAGRFVLDEHGEKIVERIDFPINPDTGKPFIRRCRGNAIGLHFLACDFDNGITLDAAIARFSALGLEFAFYTSFNHLKSAGVEKFRLFFPFTTMCLADEFMSRREAIHDWLGSADRASVAVSQGYYVPTCPIERVHLARAGRVHGRWLDWRQFAVVIHKAPPTPSLNPIIGEQLSNYVRAAIVKECERMAACPSGDRHSTLIAAATSLGQLVAAGALTLSDYEADLTSAAMAAGMGGRLAEVRKTIRDGLGYGRHNPRALPEQTSKNQSAHALVSKLRKMKNR
jgi:hypothetical protein